MTRGSPAKVVIWPADPLLELFLGWAKIGVFVRTSQGNSICPFVNRKVLEQVKGKYPMCGPRPTLRPALPNCPGCSNWKASVKFGASARQKGWIDA